MDKCSKNEHYLKTPVLSVFVTSSRPIHPPCYELKYSFDLSFAAVMCPVGTYLNTTSGICTLYAENTYQDQEGQERCELCQKQTASVPGSYSRDMCKLYTILF